MSESYITFGAAGTSAPLFVTVTGLSMRVLDGRNHLLIKIKGLCAGGGGVNIDHPSEGYVLFIVAQPNAGRSSEVHALPAEHYITICHKELH